MFDDSAPIADAGRLEPGTEEYQSVVVNKGAMVFHMLRAMIGDANFNSLLKDFYSSYAGKSARIQDFEKLAETQAFPAGAGRIQDGQYARPLGFRGTHQLTSLFHAMAAFHGRS